MIFLGMVWLAMNLSGPGQASASEPKLVLAEDHFDFGEVFEDRQLNHTFVIKNSGNAPLEISKVDPDCACTVADYERTIPAGGQGEISLKIKPYSVLRQFRKETRVCVNDPDAARIQPGAHGNGQAVHRDYAHPHRAPAGLAGDQRAG